MLSYLIKTKPWEIAAATVVADSRDKTSLAKLYSPLFLEFGFPIQINQTDWKTVKVWAALVGL